MPKPCANNQDYQLQRKNENEKSKIQFASVDVNVLPCGIPLSNICDFLKAKYFIKVGFKICGSYTVDYNIPSDQCVVNN